MPDLPSVIAAAILANQLPQERILFGVVVSEFLSSGDFNLHQLPVFFGDDGRMGVLDVILGHFAFVLLGFMLKEINDESLLKKSVPLIFLVLKNGKYGVRSPSSLAGRCLDSFVIEFFGDAGKSRSRHEVKIDVSNDLGFLFVDFYFSIRSLFVTQERPVWHRNLSVGESLPLPPSDVLGNGPGFLLSQAGHDGDEKLAFGIERIDVLLFKIAFDIVFLELSNIHQTIDGVASESGYRLGDYQIDLAAEGIVYHPFEAFPPFCVGSAYSFVGVDSHKLPIGSSVDVIGIIVHLGFIGSLLLFLVGGNTGVSGHPPFSRTALRKPGQRIDGWFNSGYYFFHTVFPSPFFWLPPSSLASMRAFSI